jgi:SAM-dependent MidA family methyltransferase
MLPGSIHASVTDLSHLPAPGPEAAAVSQALRARIGSEIEAAGGWLGFARFMELALYAPGLGYYSAGSRKLGADGDFVTAPELSPLFARCLARQVSQLTSAGLPEVIELGAGSGTLAAELLAALAVLDALPQRYRILEVSADLRERQRACLAHRAPHLAHRVEWIETLPTSFEGVLVANEVFDAIPTHVVRTCRGVIEEAGVTNARDGAGFDRAFRPAAGELLRVAKTLDLTDDYETEINLAAPAFVKSFARILARGVLLLIDYGFPAREYYHPQRSRGTLMCHYRHHAHPDPFAFVGLQDITAHVDFTAIAAAGVAADLRVLGYATQAQFLLNTGLTDLLAETPADDVRAYAPLSAQAQKLVSPAEMGELFKVLALGRGIDVPLIGFARGDRTHTL